MDIGIGIPNSVRGTTGAQLLEWARRADAAGFSTLASIGAVSYALNGRPGVSEAERHLPRYGSAAWTWPATT